MDNYTNTDSATDFSNSIPSSSTCLNRLTEKLVKSYPVINESELAYVQELDKELVLTPDIANCFSEYIACKGAYGFTFEVPKEENGYSLKQRIEMNLIATDRVLARHYLDI